MMNQTVKAILISAIKIRISKGEKPEDILLSYTKLEDKDKYELLTAVKEG